eukprot:gene9064-12226_t
MQTVDTRSCYEFMKIGDEMPLGKTSKLGLSGESFSFMCWIKLNQHSLLLRDQLDQTIIGQRYYTMGECECLHIVIRERKPYFGFYGMDTASSTELSLNKWYHLSFVYDIVSRTQSIYINSRLDKRSENPISPLRGNHELYYSHYANPLKGLLAAPFLCSRMVATEVDMHHHISEYSLHQVLNPQMMVDLRQRVSDPSWPPALLSQCILESQATLCKTSGSDEFLDFFESGLATDAIVTCNNVDFHVHKIIVGGRSEFFRSAFFTSGMLEQQESVMRFHEDDGLDSNLLRLFFKSLYTYQVDLTEVGSDINILLDLLNYCDRFQAGTLIALVEQCIINLVTKDTEKAAQVLAHVVDLPGLHLLKETCSVANQFYNDYIL